MSVETESLSNLIELIHAGYKTYIDTYTGGVDGSLMIALNTPIKLGKTNLAKITHISRDKVYMNVIGEFPREVDIDKLPVDVLMKIIKKYEKLNMRS